MVNLQVVPDGWAARHRPIVHGFFHDTVRIERIDPTQTGRDKLGTKIEVWTTVAADIPAQVQVVHTSRVDERDATGKPVLVSDYYARLDVEWLPEDGDRIVVTASEDPGNLGTYIVHRRESQTHVVDRTLHLTRVSSSRRT